MTGLGMDGAPGPTLGTVRRGEQIVHLPCRCGHYGDAHTHYRPGTDCARHGCRGCWCDTPCGAAGQPTLSDGRIVLGARVDGGAS